MVEKPMVPVTDALLDRMVQAIVDEVDPEQVILFGSRARGDEHESSDIDLIVVEAEPFGPGRSRHKELVRLYHALAGFHVPADILVYSHEDIAYWRDSLNHVLARALREGRVLYEPATLANRPAVEQGNCGMLYTNDVKCARMLLDAATRAVDALRSHDPLGRNRRWSRSDSTSSRPRKRLLKAWLALLGEMYPLDPRVSKTLLDLPRQTGAPPRNLSGSLIDYTPYAVEFRYVGVDLRMPSRLIATARLRIVEALAGMQVEHVSCRMWRKAVMEWPRMPIHCEN